MGKVTSVQNSFTSGELSPKLEGRGDIQEYFNGVALFENLIPGRGGGAFKRPGTQYVKDLSGTTQAKGGLYPLVISRTESYLVSLTTNELAGQPEILVKVYRADFTGQQTLVEKTVANSLQTVGAIIGTPPSSRKFNFVQIFDLMVFTHISGFYEPFVVRKLADGTFEANPYSTEVVRLGSPVRGIVYPDYNQVSSQVMTLSGGGTLLDLSSDFVGFVAGETFKIKTTATNDDVYKIVVKNSSIQYQVVALVGGGNYNNSDWAKQSWSREGGYPKAVSLFQQRLAFGGTKANPTGVWFTNTENLFLILNKKLLQDSATDASGIGFYGVILNSDPFGVTLTSNQSNGIQWMTSDRVLQIGTTSSEYVVSTVDGKFGPANVNVSAQTFFGSNDSAAIRAQNATVFISTDGKSLREVSFSFENGSNVSRLLSILSDQMVYHNIKSTESVYDTEFEQVVYQPSRSCIWAITNHQELVGLVIEESGKVLAWHRHIIAGTDVKIWGIASIPDDLGRYDNLYLSVERTIDGATATYIEVIGPDFENTTMYGQDNTDLRNFPIYTESFYTPSTFSHGATKADVPHLTGETVEVLEKGIYKGTKVVKDDLGGSPYIDISTGLLAHDIIIGLPYKARLKSMKHQKGSQTGTSDIQIKRIDRLMVSLFRSLKYKIGTREDNAELVDKSVQDKVQLFTGEHSTMVTATPDTEQRFYIESNGPYPLNILSVGVRGMTED